MSNPAYFLSSNVVFTSPMSPLLLSYADPAQYGILASQISQRHSMEEMNDIIMDLLHHQPYLSGTPCLEIVVMQDDGVRCTPVHNLRFHNNNWREQERDSCGIQFLQ